MAPVGGLLWRSLRPYQIWGANTDVGKTVFSSILCSAARSSIRGNRWVDTEIYYLKPVSTGPLDDADDKCAFIETTILLKLMLSADDCEALVPNFLLI